VIEYRSESSNIALFTHNIFKITDQLSATVGVRYTREKKSLEADLFSNTQCGAYRANIARLLRFRPNPGLGPLSPAAAALANALARPRLPQARQACLAHQLRQRQASRTAGRPKESSPARRC
jgi:hypothetical protein